MAVITPTPPDSDFQGFARRGLPDLPLGARPYPAESPEPGGAQTARYHPRKPHPGSRPQSARRPPPLAPSPVLLGVGTQGLGEACNSELSSVARQIQRRWLRTRVRELCIARASREAHHGRLTSRERWTAAKQEKEREREYKEEQQDRLSAKLSKEHKQLIAKAREARESVGQELVARVSEDRDARQRRLTVTWQWLGWEHGQVTQQPLWHDFCPRDSDRIEEAFQSGAPAVEMTDSVFLGVDSGSKRLIVRLKLDEDKRRWAENAETKERWMVRRQHRIRAPQNGGLSPQREQRMEQERRVLCTVMEQMQQEAHQIAEKRREQTREAREQRQEQRQRVRQLLDSRQKELRDMVTRDRRRLNRKMERFKRESVDTFEQLQEAIKRERQEWRLRRDHRRQEHEQICEKRYKALQTAKAKERERRKEFDKAERQARVESVHHSRERRKQQAAALREEAAVCASPTSVQLSLAQWGVRTARWEQGFALREAEKALRAKRQQDLDEEFELRLESHDWVLEADERRRRRGIMAGGGGLGEASGGLIKVSPPRSRRSPRSACSDEE